MSTNPFEDTVPNQPFDIVNDGLFTVGEEARTRVTTPSEVAAMAARVAIGPPVPAVGEQPLSFKKRTWEALKTLGSIASIPFGGRDY